MKLHPNFVLETCLYAEDLQACEAFYTNILGLELYSKDAHRHLFFRCGHGMFLLFKPDVTQRSHSTVPPHGAMGPGHVAFAIPPESIDRWREHLQNHGIAIETEIDWPSGGHSIYFRDPAGNSIELATPQTWDKPGE